MKITTNIIFFLIICIPLSVQIFDLEKNKENNENRKLATFPKFKEHHILNQYPKKISEFISDNFAYKSNLIAQKTDLDITFFNGPFSTKRALIGENGFYFYYKDSWIIDDVLRKNLLTTVDIRHLMIKEKFYRKFCRKKGIEFIRTTYPNKHTIYNELLPNYIQKSRKDTISRLDQFIAISLENKLNVVDLRAVMLENKSQQLYELHDSHWNENGAYIAYNYLMNHIEHQTKDSSYHPLPLDSFNISTRPADQNDLIPLLGLNNQQFLNEMIPKYFYKGKKEHKILKELTLPPKSYHVRNKYSKSDKKIMLITDSYGIAQRRMYKNHFREFLHLRNRHFDTTIINQFKPDLIIYGFVERNGFRWDKI